LDLKQLEYFTRVAEMGSFTRASIALDIAQPTLSRQVRLLESELQQHLLIRDGRGVVPNEAGKILLEHARGVLYQVSLIKDELDRTRGLAAGRVAVGLPPSPARVLTVPLSHTFKQRFPDASITIKEGLSESLKNALLNGQLDVALIYNPHTLRSIDLTPIREDSLYMVIKNDGTASETETVTLEQLAEVPLLIPSEPHSIRMLLAREMSAMGHRLRIALEIDSVQSILDLVLDGAGAAILPLHAVQTSRHPEAFTAQEILAPSLKTRLALARCSNRPQTEIQKAMETLLIDIAKKYLGPQPTFPSD